MPSNAPCKAGGKPEAMDKGTCPRYLGGDSKFAVTEIDAYFGPTIDR